MRTSMKKAQGFTLIELIIVIIILGILAVTAAPKFIDIQSDASRAALKGLNGSIAGAMTITYGKSALEGEQKESLESTSHGVETVYGYPRATKSALETAAGFTDADFTVIDTGITPEQSVYIHPSATTYTDAAAVLAGKCYVKYIQAESATEAAALSTDTSGC